MKFSIKKLLTITAFIAFAVWALYTVIEESKPDFGENVPRVSWLPESAANVSFYRSYMFTAYEFDISEPEFIAWSKWEVSEIDEPVMILRYAHVTGFGGRDVTIEDGLYYEYTQRNGGGVWVGYDRRRGRAYYHSSPR